MNYHSYATPNADWWPTLVKTLASWSVTDVAGNRAWTCIDLDVQAAVYFSGLWVVLPSVKR